MCRNSSMEAKRMFKRWQTEKVQHLLSCRRGVNLTGARQVGKSTLTEMLDLPNAKRWSLDDDDICKAAADDANGFVKHAPNEIIIIDEIQKVPRLLNSIKMVVDRDNSKGQYLLTGSANLRFAKMVKDSLAGRLGVVRLRQLAFAEMNGCDAIVFTAGVGENDITMRELICHDLGNLGIKIDPLKNKIRGKETIISADDAKIKCLLIPTNEELMIAKDTYEIVKGLK